MGPIHGDLQYDNIIISLNSTIHLLDWRHEFGSSVLLGDLYYDLAKLIGGLYINYSRIKCNDFEARLSADGDLAYSYTQDSYAAEHISAIQAFIDSKGLSLQNIRRLVSLIYINMAPLHTPPFDLLLLAKSYEIFYGI